ncbi:hypothetical protein ACTWPB_07545 [Nocardia sp. IBHARD005]|uniref:hypothetical protein n=1 Tax=Nocardia sp. IBHARD005 TaxID=3457765 RepID=UPI00405A286D
MTLPDSEVIRAAFLDAVFSTSATIGAALGISGRALYESLAPLAEDATLACIVAAEDGIE